MPEPLPDTEFRLVPWPLRIFIGLALAFLFANLLGAFSYLIPLGTQLLSLRHVLTGHGAGASFAQAIDAGRAASRQAQATLLVNKEEKLLAREGDLEKWASPMGDFWLPSGSISELPYTLGEQMRDIYGDAFDGVHPGDVVLDCGANIGVFTRVALQRGASLVVAIEPVPENLASLQRNFAPEIAAGKVVIYPKGVWDRDDVLTMQIDEESSARDSFIGNRVSSHKHTISLPVTTLDRMAQELNLKRVDFIKMDIEGAEQKALAGGRQTIVRNHPRMALCTYHRPEDAAGVPRLVKDFVPGYQMRQSYLAEEHDLVPQVAHFF